MKNKFGSIPQSFFIAPFKFSKEFFLSFKTMLTVKRLRLFSAVLISLLIFFSSCVNIEQVTAINENGSGTIILHYWTKSTNLSMGDEVGGFSFSEDKAKENFTSANSDVTGITIDNLETDSSTHVRININFSDINKLTQAEGFSKVRASWTKSGSGMDFKYIIAKDTAASNSPGAGEYKLEYKFDFPGEVTSTNGDRKGNSVTWNKTVADLNEDIEMTASVKTKSKACGIFGIELPAVLLLGFLFSGYKLSRKRRKNFFKINFQKN